MDHENVDHLVDRVVWLELENRRLARRLRLVAIAAAAAAVLSGSVLALVALPPALDRSSVSARRFVLRSGPAGEAPAALGIDDRGWPQLNFFGVAGKAAVVLAASPAGDGLIAVHPPSGGVRMAPAAITRTGRRACTSRMKRPARPAWACSPPLTARR